jgi:hypothetical protein
MTHENQNTWKSYVDWWPTYIMIGIALGYFIDETDIVQKLTNKLFKKESE